MLKALKFGGTSLADAAQFRKVKDIVLADPSRRFVVVSAPGKRTKDDEKITDLLLRTWDLRQRGEDYREPWKTVSERFLAIEEELRLPRHMHTELAVIEKKLLAGCSRAYMASRGEFLSAVLMSEFLSFPFADAAKYFRFHDDGTLDDETTKIISEDLGRLSCAVIPGFYGATASGEIKTFSRGGSDVSGALTARAVHANVYENWTDVDGFLMADPRIVKKPKRISILSYPELRELSYMGASVLHEDSIFPVKQARIPIHVMNTNNPSAPGTRIVNPAELAQSGRHGTVTGIAGTRGFVIITLTKANLHHQVGFAATVLNILVKYNINLESLPSGIDTMSIILREEDVHGHMDALYHDIREQLKPDTITVSSCIALIAVVGRGMARNRGTSGRLFDALGAAGVNVRIIDQGPSEMNIIVGVEQVDFEDAIRAIYNAFAE